MSDIQNVQGATCGDLQRAQGSTIKRPSVCAATYRFAVRHEDRTHSKDNRDRGACRLGGQESRPFRRKSQRAQHCGEPAPRQNPASGQIVLLPSAFTRCPLYPPKRDITSVIGMSRFVPKADILIEFWV